MSTPNPPPVNPFAPAEKSVSPLRMAVTGPAGGGKTYTALCIATMIGGKTAVIDTERGSASKYAGDPLKCEGSNGESFSFDVLNLDRYAPEDYMKALVLAYEHGYKTVVIDSLTHAWHELKEQNELLAHSKFRGNTWGAWSESTPRQKALLDAILRFPGDVIATIRSKTKWEIVGKSPKKIGLAPDQRDGVDYEFDVILAMSDAGNGWVEKTRCDALSNTTWPKPGKLFTGTIMNWLRRGEV